MDMKSKGDSCHEYNDNGSPDVVGEGIDRESGDASPVDDRQHCENPESDSGRIDGGDEEECRDAGKDADCRMNLLRHV